MPHHSPILALIGGLCLPLVAACTSAHSATTQEVSTALPALVETCRMEAQSDHALLGPRNRVWRAEVVAHKRRMTEVCDAWSAATPDTAEALRQRCNEEAAGGPNVRTVAYAPHHIERMQELCGKLADAVHETP